MQLGDQQASGNVEDRRGIGIGGGLGIGGVVVAVIAYFLGFDPGTAIDVAQQVTSPREEARAAAKGAPPDEAGQFVSRVLGSTETVWGAIFRESIKAPGDFAQAYVIAHEVGHHVQRLTGALDRVDSQRGRPSGADSASVRMELQADCYAGVWGHHAAILKQLDSGDAAEALAAATAIGDDRLQRQGQRRVVPESFTHGTSAQRVKWFQRGLDSGRPKDCATSGAAAL